MEKFIVSARKYRPQTFDTVVGQKHITTTLKNAIQNNQLAHAYLFCGPRGVGKTTCARIFAKTINCEHITPEGEACDQCPSCKSFNEGTSLNISELDAASNNSVEDIRSLVEQVRFAPQAGKYKVYIIDEVHMLSQAAFNAFLKTLEEPPSYVVFILATTEKHKLLPTILSRCQIFDFKRITNNDTVEHLEEIATKEHINAPKAALQVIAQKSEGCMRDALSILDKIVSFTEGKLTLQNTLENLNILDYDYFFRLLDLLLSQDLSGALLLYDEINKKGFEGDIVLNGFAEFIRNIMVAKNPKSIGLLDVVDGLSEKYTQAAARVDTSFLVSALNILNEAEINFKMARNKRLHVEMTLIKLNYLQQAIQLSVSNEGAVVKKKRLDGPVAWRKEILPDWKPTATVHKTTEPATVAEDAKLYIQEKPKAEIATSTKPPVVESTPTIPVKKAEPVTTMAPPTRKSNGAKFGLQSILAQIGANNGGVDKPTLVLEQELLQKTWMEYGDKLLSEDKPSVGNAFKSATVEVISETEFKVSVFAELQKKFIELEKGEILDVVHKAFHNRQICISIEVIESEEINVPQDKPLTPKESFELMVQKNPQIRILKDNLNMRLDW